MAFSTFQFDLLRGLREGRTEVFFVDKPRLCAYWCGDLSLLQRYVQLFAARELVYTGLIKYYGKDHPDFYFSAFSDEVANVWLLYLPKTEKLLKKIIETRCAGD